MSSTREVHFFQTTRISATYPTSHSYFFCETRDKFIFLCTIDFGGRLVIGRGKVGIT